MANKIKIIYGNPEKVEQQYFEFTKKKEHHNSEIKGYKDDGENISILIEYCDKESDIFNFNEYYEEVIRERIEFYFKNTVKSFEMMFFKSFQNNIVDENTMANLFEQFWSLLDQSGFIDKTLEKSITKIQKQFEKEYNTNVENK